MKVGTLGIAALVTTASIALAAAVPLDVKTGLWGMTNVATMGGVSRTFKAKDCMTAKDLQQGAFGNKDSDDECTYTPTVATATRNESTVKCASGQHGTMKVEALSREQVKGDITMTGGGQTTTVTLTGKWLRAACTEADEN